MCPYVHLFLFGLLCTGAVSAETATCTAPRAQSNIDVNQIYGDWFLGQANIAVYAALNESQCYPVSVKKINETAIEVTNTITGEIRRQIISIENAENAGTWHVVDENRTEQVIYLSADGTTMAIAGCLQYVVEPFCILLGKQLPISLEKIGEVLHAAEQAGISGSHCRFTWESEATCPST